MRKVKFRGRDFAGLWHIGDLIHNDDDLLIRNGCLSTFIENETAGQFTGITDKNGKEIYEGDIIGCHNPDIKHLIFYNEKQGRFMAALNGDIDNDFVGVCGLDDSRWNASKEVIGNIHDNPELLKGGTK